MYKDPFSNNDDKCKCCNGKGTQMNKKKGLVEKCPCCKGTGKEKKEKKPGITFEPKFKTGLR